MSIILGLNAYHGDSSACIVVNGKLTAAVEEERFRRIKHWAGVPSESVAYCLSEAGIRIDQVDHIAVNRNPAAHALHKLGFVLARRPGIRSIQNRLKNAFRIREIRPILAEHLGVRACELRAREHFVEHHDAHLASAFFVSPFDDAAVVSVDGFGDFVSSKWGFGEGNRIRTSGLVAFPHSLGLFYLAITQHLGFAHYGDEYKVMGMAAYGQPRYLDQMRKILLAGPAGSYRLDLSFFTHHTQGVQMAWHNAAPEIGMVFSPKLSECLGPERSPSAEITQHHKDIAASAQAAYEEAFFRLLNHVQHATQKKALCLAGGCAFNSLANGRIFERTSFEKLYIQSAAGDAGGALGAAYYVWNQQLKKPRSFVMDHAYWGPAFDDARIAETIAEQAARIDSKTFKIEKIVDQKALVEKTAQAISQGEVIGWYQGRMEWGPRALGNRSILCDPRCSAAKDLLNLKIKRRESFRPFAPSILREKTAEWFEVDADVPFMMQVYKIRRNKRALVPAVTHADGTGRLQTVSRGQNERYYALIEAFEKLTGVPMLLNTSFNENEPVVCRPAEALECFLRTKMDALVMGSFYIERRQTEQARD